MEKIDLSPLMEHLPEAKSGFKLNPKHKGWCTPITKSTCTGKRKTFALNAKAHFKKRKGEEGDSLPLGHLSTDTVKITPDFQPIDLNQVHNVPWGTLGKKGLFEDYDWTPKPKGAPLFTSENLATAIAGIDAIIPDHKQRPLAMQPQDFMSVNENPYGTDSQAIMKAGGDLSSGKAAEMLKDGTAHGKKLTKKQKKYFRALAHGWHPDKMPDGGVLGGPDRKTAARVKTAPADYVFDTEEDGKKYYKKSGSAQLPMASSTGTAGGPEYEKFLQEKLASGISPEQLVTNKYISPENASKYQQYYKPSQNYVYTQPDPQTVDKPAFAFQGEPIYKGNKLYGLVQYNDRNSKGQADPGSLNTGYENVKFMYVDEYGKPVQDKGVYNIPSEDWNKEFGPTRHVKDENFFTKYNSSITKLDSGGKVSGQKLKVEDGNFKQISPSFIEFTGKSHAQGGVDIQYGKQGVEVEKGETATQDENGDLTILGNMYVPGTNMKFKTAGKKLAKEQIKAGKQNDKGSELMQDSDYHDKFEKLSFNAGMLKVQGATDKIGLIDKQKEFLSTLQQSMLSTAEELNLDPQAMSEGKVKKAKKGTTLKAPSGITIPADLKKVIEITAKKYHLPVDVLTRQIVKESGGNPSAVSNKGAKGIMQLTPAVMKKYGIKDSQVNSDALVDKFAVVDAGAHYLSDLVKQNNGDVTLGLAAYNGGQDSVNFVKKSLGMKNITGNDFVAFYKGRNQTHPTDKPNAWQHETLNYVNDIMGGGSSRHGAYGGGAGVNPNFAVPAPTDGQLPVSAYADGTGTDAQLPESAYAGTEDNNPYYNPNWKFGDPIPKPNFALYDPPEEAPKVELIPPGQSANSAQEYPGNFDFNDPDISNLPSNITKLQFEQYAPELYSLATNKVQAVPAQKFIPREYSPYQVSFQDRINQNNQTFSAIQSTLSDNPEALSTMAAQLYNANSQVGAEEFRTNQGINNEVINKNVALANQAEQSNLSILDNQFVRQSQAKSNTKALNKEILSSISAKVLQNQYENKTLAAQENLSNYRMVDTDGDGYAEKAVYLGPKYEPSDMGTTPYSAGTSEDPYTKYSEQDARYDKNGVLLGYQVKDKWLPAKGYRPRVKGKEGMTMQAIYNKKYGRR